MQEVSQVAIKASYTIWTSRNYKSCNYMSMYIYTVHVDISYFCCIPSPSHNDAACSSHACKSVIGCIGPFCTSPCGLIKMLGEKKRVSCTTHCPGYVLHHTVCIGNYMYITSHELCLTNLNNTHTHTVGNTIHVYVYSIHIIIIQTHSNTYTMYIHNRSNHQE